MKKQADKIDFVVLWVDPSDKEWQKTREKYAKQIQGEEYVDNSTARYRDWGIFQYWFRGVENFAPWVNKVHLVTCGHLPKWLNTNHPKLNIVKHSDFMPEDALPTFNTNAIELCLHKIPGLSEQFVLFNDDVFLIKSTTPTDFFKNGKPVNTMSLLAITPSSKRGYCRTLVNNIEIINDHFSFSKCKKDNLVKFFSPKQKGYLLTTIPLLAYKDFPGFKNCHIGNSYLKSTYEKIWQVENAKLDATIHERFRNYETNVSDWVVNYWQFAEGNYYQKDVNFGVNIEIGKKETNKIIKNQKRRIICLSEPENEANIEDMKTELISSFESILPRKSKFEII